MSSTSSDSPSNGFDAPKTVIFGTRRSKLALWQTHQVKQRLAGHFPKIDFQVREFSTRGDENLHQPLPEIGGKGLFTAELDRALKHSEIDIAVHSLKDLPTEHDLDLAIVPVMEREDARDVLVSRCSSALVDLPVAATVGTSSPRRQAQLASIRPDLNFRSIRGNVPTRIAKVLDGQYDAAVLAAAGIVRLEMQQHISQWFSFQEILPAAGQAMVAATVRRNDVFIADLLKTIFNPIDSQCVQAERLLLQKLGGGCSAPIGIAATKTDGQFQMQVVVSSMQGKTALTSQAVGDDPERLASELAHLLHQQNVDELLSESRVMTTGTTNSLAGKRIVLTRSQEQCVDHHQQLQAMGADPISIPVIRFQALESPAQDDDPLQQLSSFQWIVFTSSNGVRFFFQRLKAAGASIDDCSVRFACVGSKTSATLAQFGHQASLVPDCHNSDSLVSAIQAEMATEKSDMKGRRFLYPSAKTIATDWPAQLTRLGCEVVQWPIYETISVDLAEPSIQQLREGVDVLTFASPSAVTSFCAQMGKHDLFQKIQQEVMTVCIGKTTESVAQTAGFRVTETPQHATMNDLIEGLPELLANK